jgi:hypothetical protein
MMATKKNIISNEKNVGGNNNIDIARKRVRKRESERKKTYFD